MKLPHFVEQEQTGAPVDAPPRPAGRRWWWWLLSAGLAAALFYLACRGVNWSRVWRMIVGAEWRWLAAAAALNSFSYWLRSVRWRILLNAEARLGVAPVFWANMAGYLGNNVLPARAGELVRSILITRRSRLSTAYVLTTALSERLMDVIALVLGSAVVLLSIEPKPRWMQDVSRTLAFGAAAAAVAVVVLPHAGKLFEIVLARVWMPAGLRPRAPRLVEQVLLGLKAFHHWGRMLSFVVMTVVIWAVDAATVSTFGHALGLPISLKLALLLLAGIGLSTALPSTPGYVGIYQFVAVTILTPFGFSRDAALALILVNQTIGYAVVAIFGIPGLYRLRRSPQ